MGNMPEFGIEVEQEFFTWHHAVFVSRLHYAMDGAQFGAAGELLKVEVPLIVVLEIRDGEVVSHRDYSDYDAMAEQTRAAVQNAQAKK